MMLSMFPAHSICACISAKHISRGRPAMALSWALKGRHSVLAGRAADLMLRGYSETGVLPATDLLLTLGPAMVMHDRLLLLGKRCLTGVGQQNIAVPPVSSKTRSATRSGHVRTEALLLPCSP